MVFNLDSVKLGDNQLDGTLTKY